MRAPPRLEKDPEPWLKYLIILCYCELLRLAPGGRIINEENRTILHSYLPQQAHVFYVEDMNGDISRIYLLRPDELESLQRAR